MLDVIYERICERALDNSSADDVITAIEEQILSLKTMPLRGSDVTTGLYTNQGYRKVLVKNHIIIYRVFEDTKEVIVVFVKHEKMNT